MRDGFGYGRGLRALGRRLCRDEAGGLTIFGLFMFLSMAIIGGLAVDVTHAYSERTRLQVAADVAAHAALFNRRSMSPDDAKLAAINLVHSTMPKSRFGEFIRPSDFEFGSYDYVSRSFVPDAASRKSMRVNTARLQARSNPVDSFFSQLIGHDSWDVRTAAVFVAFLPPCFREGFTAEGIVKVNSNNAYLNGFCLHSNTSVSMNNKNTFEPGTAVSMPNLDLLKIPASGFTHNTGLDAALKVETQDIREIRHLPDIIAGLSKPGSPHYPSYLTSSAIIDISKSKYTPSDFQAGRIYRLGCNGSTAKIDPDITLILRKVVLLTSCDVQLGAGLALEDAVIATTSSSTASIKGPSGVRLGRIDNCQPGGGAQLLTLGGVSFSADLQMHGGQIIAKKDVGFTAGATGVGLSVIAGGTIDGTSGMSMFACGERGMEGNFHIDHYRLAE
ncbi:Tad domain-containing protein [Limimaricola soesokkakensis]|uniref:Tad domain-containing protein n=1 Tax=Limimaricola soesokkakensis TaxID=1343159 RepID=UPI0035196E6B